MINKLTKIETVHSIDSILHKPKNTVYSKSEYAEVHSKGRKENDELDYNEEFSKDQLKDMVEEAKKMMNGVNRQLSFRVHEGTGRDLIQLVDAETKDVIREIPPEKMLDILAGIWQWAGVLVDRKE